MREDLITEDLITTVVLISRPGLDSTRAMGGGPCCSNGFIFTVAPTDTFRPDPVASSTPVHHTGVHQEPVQPMRVGLGLSVQVPPQRAARSSEGEGEIILTPGNRCPINTSC